MDPTRCGLRIEEHFPAAGRVKLFTDLREDLWGDPNLAERFQRLDDNPALGQLEACFLERGVLEEKGLLAYTVGSLRPVGEVNHSGWNLSRKTKQILGGRTVWLDSPTEFPGERIGNLIDVRGDCFPKYLAVAGEVVNAADHPPDDACFFQPVEAGIDG